MFCTKCGKQVDDDIKFCPGCGSSFGDAVSNSSPDRGGESNSWLKIGKIAVVTVGLVACVAIGYLRASKADAIDSKENLSIIAELVTKSIVAIEELKPIAKVSGCTSVSLDMNSPLESLEEGQVRKVYKGVASVEMFPRKSSSESEDSIEYASSAVTVRYDIMVVDAGKEIVLKEAEMRDADWKELLVAAGLFDEESEENDDEEDDEDEENDVDSAKDDTSRQVEAMPAAEIVDGMAFVREWLANPNRTDVQAEEMFNRIKGCQVVLRNLEVLDVRKNSDDGFMRVMRGLAPDEASYEKVVKASFPPAEISARVLFEEGEVRVKLGVSDIKEVKCALQFNKGDKIKIASGIVYSLEGYNDVFRLIDSKVTMDDNVKLNEEPPISGDLLNNIDALLNYIQKLMEEQNEMTQKAVGWRRNSGTAEELKMAREFLLKLSEAERVDLLKEREGENKRLKEFLEICAKIDATRKSQGQGSLTNEEHVKKFLFILNPDKQMEYIKRLRKSLANAKID